MKHLKMLGLAAIAALGLMAFLGAGTASATTLATNSAGTIKYAAGTEIHSTLKTGTSALLETTGGSTIATCTGSTVKGKTSNETGTSVSGSIETLTWTGCSQTTDNVTLGSLSITKSTGDSGTVAGSGTEVTLGVFGVSCTYGTGASTTLGTITGGAAPVLAINAVLSRTAGDEFLCPKSGRWTAEYVVTSPHELHIIS